MSAPVEFTGERFLPECTGEIWVEHWHRYLFAAHFGAGKDVLDAACGEGYGSAWLARRARSVTGLDIDDETVRRASGKYQAAGLRFETGSVAAMPFADASFDCAISFETLEHVAEQDAMLAEFRRVLRPDGLLIISTPNRPEYSERRNFRNEFHVRELDEPEFHALIARHFPNQRWFGQKLLFNSGVWPLAATGGSGAEWIALDDVSRSRLPVPMYFIALASPRAIPETGRLTLMADPDETIYREFEQTVSRVGTLERLTQERDAQLRARAAQIAHLEALAVERERIVVERDRQLEAQSARAQKMESVIAEREKTLAERSRQLDAIGRRASRLDELVAEREKIIVQRDAELVACNERIDRAESLINQRDAELAAINARVSDAEKLIAHRETVIVERDRLLVQTNQRASALESLVVERERIIVERDAQLAAANELGARVTADLARANQSHRNAVEEIEAARRALQMEVARRGSLRWWFALPYLRLRRALNLEPPASEHRREA